MNLHKLITPLLKRFPSLRETALAIRDHRNTKIPAQTTPFGFKFAGPPSMINGTFEGAEMPLIRNLIRKNDLFINIGANVGYYCCFAAMEGKPIIAFEPHAVNILLLLRNLEVNGFGQNAEVYPTAVGAKNGILNLYGSGTAASLVEGWAGIPSENSNLVPVVTLDGILSGRYEDQSIFVLIDVEGAERDVLQGALQTLRRNRKPWWLIEITISEHQPAGISINPNLLATFELIYEIGYEVWTLAEAPRRVHLEEIATIAKEGIDTIGIHNFLCVDPLAAADAISSIKQSL